MRDYAVICPTFWTQGSGRRLRGDMPSQLLALYLFSCPASTMSGVFPLPMPTIVYETGLTEQQVLASLERLADEDVAHYDHELGLVWVVNMIRYQVAAELKPQDKRVTALVRELTPYRGHPFVEALIRGSEGAFCLPDHLGMPLARPMEAASKALRGSSPRIVRVTPEPKPLRSQDQDQDQGHEQEQDQNTQIALARDPSATASGEGLVPARDDVLEVVRHYQTYHPRSFPKGIRADMREYRLIKARLRESTVDDLKDCIDGYHLSPHHRGLNDKNQEYLSLALFVRDYEHVQSGIAMSQRPPDAGLSARDRGNVWAAQQWLAKTEGAEGSP